MSKTWKFTVGSCLASLALWVLMLAMEASDLERKLRGHERTIEWLEKRYVDLAPDGRPPANRLELLQLQMWNLDFQERLKKFEANSSQAAKAYRSVVERCELEHRSMPRISESNP